MRGTSRAAAVLACSALGLGCLVAAPAASAGSTGTGAARPPGAQGRDCAVAPDAPKRQLRGDWIASVVNIDWPSRPGLSVADQKAELEQWYDEAAARGLNAVVVQVRPTADTFWPSDLEPWSRYLTGTPGGDPGYDPLAFAVEQAHARNLEFHAWFNPYRVSMNTDREALAPDHPARRHPDWLVSYGGKLYYNPGIPAVRRHVEDVILEATTRYDIDAVHFDDYFYPYPAGGVDFPDADTYATYGDGFDTVGDWRRHNTDLLVSELDQQIHAVKPWVKFGVSPFAVWRNAGTDPEGSATTAGAETYDDLYADTRGWVRKGWLDYIAPQVYWNIGFAPADYAKLVPWWAEQVEGTDAQLYIGQATYKVGTSTQSPAWADPEEMTRHLTFNRDFPQVQGDIYFSAKDVRANRLGHMDLVQADHYAHPALIPVTQGVPGRAPRPVGAVAAERTPDGIRLTWDGDDAAYAIYRVSGRSADLCDTADAEHLLGWFRADSEGDQAYLDEAAPSDGVTYYVTALDRAYRESVPRRIEVR
ncbi:glycoside hydrolase family 10 protein [Nocardioides mesophilus]|uniref:Family 10 glycosylhydrolase n=1 Tax=Nocardioides mesophilus TaxID=433659 RepID=A0A7G9RBQ0_9ACTN|nr:family 10 glycosylhydrolase [Nocardioides mesophilus]QNN53025.1 family 10 glycosylhydrolase [Nocardioides mesophilus]